MEETKTDDIRLAEIVAKTKTDKGLSEVRAMANGKDRDAMLARAALRQMGGKEGQANFPSGSTEMADGGMARGRGNKMYQHNYATGGSVTDHLKSVPADNKGLSKLPEGVRNQMGYMSYGGMAKKKTKG